MSLDRSKWPRCLLWHGWLPGLKGIVHNDPWALSFGDLASFYLERCLGAYPVDFGGAWTRLQGFRPGQGTPAVGVEQTVEFPVPQRRRKRSGGFEGFSLDRIQQRFVEQITSAIQLLTVVEEVLVEIFKASPRDRAQQRFVEQNTLTLLFLTVEIFKASPRDRAHQRFVEQFRSTFPFLMVVLEREVFAVFPEDSFPQRLPVSRPSFLLVEVFKKVFKVEDRSEVLRTRLRIGRMEISTRRCWLKRRG